MNRKIILFFCISMIVFLVAPQGLTITTKISTNEDKSDITNEKIKISGLFAYIEIEGQGYFLKEGPFVFFKINSGKIDVDFKLGSDFQSNSAKGFFISYSGDHVDPNYVDIEGSAIFGFIESI